MRRKRNNKKKHTHVHIILSKSISSNKFSLTILNTEFCCDSFLCKIRFCFLLLFVFCCYRLHFRNINWLFCKRFFFYRYDSHQNEADSDDNKLCSSVFNEDGPIPFDIRYMISNSGIKMIFFFFQILQRNKTCLEHSLIQF